jgi:hypothetical protein
MSKFLAINPFPKPVSFKEGTPIGKKVKANSTVDVYWVRSWAQLNEKGDIVKLFCEWNAVNIGAVHKVLAKIPELPCEGVYPLAILDCEDFR